MATYQSVQSNTSDNSSSLVITKPTSLAVGDKMLAGIWTDRANGSSASLSTPSGWTQEIFVNTGIGNGALAVYSKVADSTDVAASNFTFNSTGSTGQLHMCGFLLRITSYGGNAGTASNNDTSTSTTITATGFTPSITVPGTLYVAFAGRSSPLAVSQINSMAMATSNPTWTEQAELSVNDTTAGSRFALYTANRTEVTATGTFTVTYSTDDNTRSGVAVIAISPQVNGSISQETKLNVYALSPIPVTKLNAIVDEPTTSISRYTDWQNESKPSTSWTNET